MKLGVGSLVEAHRLKLLLSGEALLVVCAGLDPRAFAPLVVDDRAFVWMVVGLADPGRGAVPRAGAVLGGFAGVQALSVAEDGALRGFDARA